MNFIFRIKKTQSKLLAGAIVKKRTSDESANLSKKPKPSIDEPQKSLDKSTGWLLVKLLF